MKLERLFIYSLIGAGVLTLILFFMPTSINDFYPNPEIYDTGFNYYLWKFRAIDQSIIAKVTAWAFFFIHFFGVMFLLKRLKENQDTSTKGYSVYNIYLLLFNAFFIVLHYIHTWVWYDALAQDTPVWSSQGSVIIMLVLVLILENQRRGLFFGKKVPVPKEAYKTVVSYHGVYIALAVIFTFWYHPMENTPWHIVGFIYMYLLFIQMSFARTKLHYNKYYNLTLEVMVLFHGTSVALFSGNAPWTMFFFGFALIFFVTQIYGIGLSKRSIHISQGLFLVVALLTYSGLFTDFEFYQINEVIRIPFIEYGLVFLFVYLIYFWIKLPLKRWMKKLLGIVIIVILAIYASLIVYTMSSYHPEPQMYDYIVEDSLTRTENSNAITYETSNYKKNIILVPGGKVMPEAYEYLAYSIALEGYKVSIVKTPFQLAILSPYQANRLYEDGIENIIMGHSLGGVVASLNAGKLSYDKIILMGSYPIADTGSSNTLILVGSEEKLLENEKFYENTVSSFVEVQEVDGGNHAYFGFYGEQKGDGVASKSNKDIQDIVVDYITDWIE